MLESSGNYLSNSSKHDLEKLRTAYLEFIKEEEKKIDGIMGYFYVIAPMLFMGSLPSVLFDGLDLVNSIFLIIGSLGSYRWYQSDKKIAFLRSEIALIDGHLNKMHF